MSMVLNGHREPRSIPTLSMPVGTLGGCLSHLSPKLSANGGVQLYGRTRCRPGAAGGGGARWGWHRGFCNCNVTPEYEPKVSRYSRIVEIPVSELIPRVWEGRIPGAEAKYKGVNGMCVCL